ncbi:MAG: hypothetical protein J6M07_10195 [Ruminococcus sp.]|nr:hypothetical protein [Ruminococcus sp.]
MTDKEFRKLKRGDLVAIIYEYQKHQEILIKENEELKEKLQSKELKISNAGSIAEAVLEMNHLFETAQKTADEYVEQVKLSMSDAEKKAEEIIAQAQKKADEIIAEAEKKADASTAGKFDESSSDEDKAEKKDTDNESKD